MEIFKNKRVLITGGTGSLGKALIKRLLKVKGCEVIAYSRDEHKHENLDKGVISFIGDVRDYDRLSFALRGVHMVIHAAAVKIVPMAEKDPIECVKTNIQGTENVVRACVEQGIHKACFISTDKAVNPVNLYGATKLVGEKLFLAANAYRRKDGPFFSVARYGNVMGSAGSVIPKWIELAKKRENLPLTDIRMTRFMMPMEEAVGMVMEALLFPPDLHVSNCKSMEMVDVGKVIWEKFGGSGTLQYECVGMREGEKLHEQLDEETFSNTADRMTDETFRRWLDDYTKKH